MVFRRSILLDWTEAWSPKKWWDKMDQIVWSNLEDNDASSQERTVATQYIWIIPTCQCAHHNVPVGLVSRIINGLVRTWLLTFPKSWEQKFPFGTVCCWITVSCHCSVGHMPFKSLSSFAGLHATAMASDAAVLVSCRWAGNAHVKFCW
jgi:hypothetical protein